MKTIVINDRVLSILRYMLMFVMIYTLILPMFNISGTVTVTESEGIEYGVGGGSLPDQYNTGEIEYELSGLSDFDIFSRPRMLLYDTYRVQRGDTISEIAVSMGLNEDTLLSVNSIRNSRLLQINQVLRIPNQDGVYHSVAGTDTLSSISQRYNACADAIKVANELFSDSINHKASLFIPGGRMDWVNRQEINGDLFVWPVTGRLTSSFGYRQNPFGGGRQFHNGIDISGPTGTAIRAAMSGRVTTAAYNDIWGNYIVISHHSGYRTLYAHLHEIQVRPGALVGTGERIGTLGSTGRSTGPHLHFTVFKDGIAVNPRVLMR